MQQLITILVVIVCAVLLVRRIVLGMRRSGGDCGCGAGGDCPRRTECRKCGRDPRK